MAFTLSCRLRGQVTGTIVLLLRLRAVVVRELGFSTTNCDPHVGLGSSLRKIYRPHFGSIEKLVEQRHTTPVLQRRTLVCRKSSEERFEQTMDYV